MRLLKYLLKKKDPKTTFLRVCKICSKMFFPSNICEYLFTNVHVCQYTDHFICPKNIKENGRLLSGLFMEPDVSK